MPTTRDLAGVPVSTLQMSLTYLMLEGSAPCTAPMRQVRFLWWVLHLEVCIFMRSF